MIILIIVVREFWKEFKWHGSMSLVDFGVHCLNKPSVNLKCFTFLKYDYIRNKIKQIEFFMTISEKAQPFVKAKKRHSVHIGNVIVGGDHSVKVQSMTNTDTILIQLFVRLLNYLMQGLN